MFCQALPGCVAMVMTSTRYFEMLEILQNLRVNTSKQKQSSFPNRPKGWKHSPTSACPIKILSFIQKNHAQSGRPIKILGYFTGTTMFSVLNWYNSWFQFGLDLVAYDQGTLE